MEKLSKKRAIELHRKMWRDLAKTGGEKYSHPLVLKYDPDNACFICEYRKQTNTPCCLLGWQGGSCMENSDSEYNKYRRHKGLTIQKKWAAKIAELPEVPVPAKKGKKK